MILGTWLQALHYQRAIEMAWYDGKTKLVVIALGDSNILAAPFTAQAGVVANNANNLFWANDDVSPYVQSGHTWRALDPDDTGRLLTQASSASGDPTIEGSATLYANQLLGSNGSSTMAFADTFETTTGIPVYTYLAGSSAATTYDYTHWLWTQLEASLTTAMAAIPATSADVIYLSLGAGDLIWGDEDFQALSQTSWRLPYTAPTAQEFYDNFVEFRSRMVAAGWWVPKTTQIVIQDIPRSGGYLSAYPAWQGLAYVLARLNDRIAMVSSIGRTYDPPLPIHYSPQSYADMGRKAAELVLEQIPRQRSTVSVGGVRLSVGGEKLRVNSA
jgi:hypothetical protein